MTTTMMTMMTMMTIPMSPMGPMSPMSPMIIITTTITTTMKAKPKNTASAPLSTMPAVLSTLDFSTSS